MSRNPFPPLRTPATVPAVVIRPCVPGDEAALALVGQASFLEAFAGVLPGSDILAHCERQHAAAVYHGWLRDGVSALWLAETEPGGAPVGYLVLTRPDLPLPELGSGDVEVKRVYLLHRFQGGGLGRRLMQAAEDHARGCGRRRLLLGVYARNADAIGFYQRLGYRPVGTRTFLVGHHRYDDLILGRDLHAAPA